VIHPPLPSATGSGGQRGWPIFARPLRLLDRKHQWRQGGGAGWALCTIPALWVGVSLLRQHAAIEHPKALSANTAGQSELSGGARSLGARRFVAVEGQPKYLTVYEFENAKVSESETWSRARAGNPWTRRVQPQLRHDEGSPGIYQLIYLK
jgi:hypothetical protein